MSTPGVEVTDRLEIAAVGNEASEGPHRPPLVDMPLPNGGQLDRLRTLSEALKPQNLGAVFLAILFVICPAFACGPYLSAAIFSHTLRPDLPLTRYAAGELGIVQPKFARSYLAVAYLYLTNRKLTAEQQKQATNMWWHRLTDFGTPGLDKALTQWRAARKQVDIPMPEDFDVYRHISAKDYTSYLNFLPQSFSTASARLNAQLKASKNGAKDPTVKAWVKAQDRIFKINSQSGTDDERFATPEKLPPEAPPAQKADRDYQIACSHFYTQNFDEAEKEFSNIAADKSSSWHTLAPYMVARTLVRAATLAPTLETRTDQISVTGTRTMTAYDCLKKAQGKAESILADKEMLPYHEAARELLGYIAAKVNPTIRAEEISRQLQGEKDNSFGQDLADYSILLDQLSPEPESDAATPTTWDWQSQPMSSASAVALLAAMLLLLCFWLRSNARGLGDGSTAAKAYDRPWMQLLALFLCAVPFVLGACSNTGQPQLTDTRDHPFKTKPFSAPPAVPNDELSRWILNYQLKTKDATEKAYREWKRSGSDAWLVSTASKIEVRDQHASEVLAAMAKIPASSTAYVTITFHRIRLLTESEKRDEAFTLLKSMLALSQDQLPPSARNILMEQGLGFAHNMDEFRRFAFLSPSTIGSTQDLDAVPSTDSASALKQLQSGEHFSSNPRCLTQASAAVINFALPLSLIKTLTAEASLAQPLKLDISQAGWVRSVMLKSDADQKAFANNLQAARPQLNKSLTEYNKAQTAAEKDFLFASIVLKNPEMRPYVSFGAPRATAFDTLDDYGNNWWNETGPGSAVSDDDSKKPALPAVHFLTDSEKKKAAEELALIKNKGTAPDYLCKLVIAWANIQPHDQRLPESLYRAVRATKVGTGDSNTSSLSKKAFLILHKNFPGNEWTKKTPYFY